MTLTQIASLVDRATLDARKILVHMGCRGEDVEDCLADARLKALRGGFEGRSSFTTWFCRIAANRWIDVRRQRRRRPLCYLIGDNYPADFQWGDIGQESQSALHLASDKELDAIQALYLYGNQRDAAESLGWSTAMLKSHIYRFRRKIGATEPYW